MENETTAGREARKPLPMAKGWMKEALRMAVRLIGYVLCVAVMGLMFSALQAIETVWLRAALSLAVGIGMVGMFFGEGLIRGVEQVQRSRRAEKTGAVQEGRAGLYHPMKAITAAAVVFAIPAAMALYLSVTAEPYAYAMQDLPGWLTSGYALRDDVMMPLGAYMQPVVMTGKEIVRVPVRMLEVVFINLFADVQSMSQTIDRLSFIWMMLYPIAYVAGYLTGPYRARTIERQNTKAKQIAVKRAQRRRVGRQLLGKREDIHYGQPEKSGKKNELI